MKRFPLLVGLLPIGLTVLGCNARYVVGQNDGAGMGGGSTTAGSGGALVAHSGGSSGTGMGGDDAISSGGFMGPGDMGARGARGGKGGAVDGSGEVSGTAGATPSDGTAAIAGPSASGGTAGTASATTSGQVLQQLPGGRARLSQLRRHARRAHAAEGAHVVRRQVGVAHYHADGGDRAAQLIGHRLRQRRTDILPHFHFAGVDGNVAALVDVQPGTQNLWRFRASPLATASRLLERVGARHGECDQDSAAQQSQEFPPIRGEPPDWAGRQFVALRFQRVHRPPPFPAHCTAATIRGYVPHRQTLPCMALRISW